MASEEDTGRKNKQAASEARVSFVVRQGDTECGARAGKMQPHFFYFQLQRFGSGGMALEAGGTAILHPLF